MQNCKIESVILLICILVLVFGYIIYKILKKLALYELELFSCRSSSNSKRSKMMKVFKSDEIYDPDETPMVCDDPDGDCGYDID
jgi:hypothetical protein